jgi:hypothetical protein
MNTEADITIGSVWTWKAANPNHPKYSPYVDYYSIEIVTIQHEDKLFKHISTNSKDKTLTGNMPFRELLYYYELHSNPSTEYIL